MAEYKLDKNGEGVIRTSDNAHIPEDMGNRHWKKYQEWLAEGNAPDPAMDLIERRDARKLEIEVEANNLIDAQVSDNPRKQLMMVAKGLNMLDAQVGRGGNPGRDPQQDQLVAIFNYVEEVNINEEAIKLVIETSNDPENESLTHPPLPGS